MKARDGVHTSKFRGQTFVLFRWNLGSQGKLVLVVSVTEQRVNGCALHACGLYPAYGTFRFVQWRAHDALRRAR